LVELKHAVTVIGRNIPPFLDKCKKAGAHTMPYTFGMDYSPLGYIKAYLILKQIKPDIIIVNVTKELRQFGLGAKRLKIPMIIRIGLALDFKNNLRNRIEFNWYLKGGIAPANEIQRNFPPALVPTIKVFHNGTQIIKNLNKKPQNKIVSFIFIGKMSKRKGVVYILEAFSELVKQNMPVQLTMIGDGPLLNELKLKYKSQKEIMFTDYIENPQKELQNSDVSILHSSQEGFPNTLLEYMANGPAIITTPVNGIVEMLKPNEEALYVDYSDVNGLKEAMLQLVNNPPERIKLSTNALKRVQKDFNIKTQTKKILDQLIEWTEK